MISAEISLIIIGNCCLVGLLYAIYNAIVVSTIKVEKKFSTSDINNQFEDNIQPHNIYLLKKVAKHIEDGANTFLFQEYKYIFIFSFLMAVVIFFAVEEKLGHFWTTGAFLLGCFTSMLAGFIGMRVAVFSNYRTAFEAAKQMYKGFSVAYRAGSVMGFSLTSLGLLTITILIALYTNMYVDHDYSDYTKMYECIAGYGLGGSTIALFGRVGGGIFTKAADVGADLVGKVEKNLPEDSPNNPATIADNVGDNVGDIAGMGSDLFGSFAESTCAALVVGSSSPTFYYQPQALYYPLLITAFGIIVSMITTLIAHHKGNNDLAAVQKTLSIQLLVSTLLSTPALWFAGYISLPDRIYFLGIEERAPIHAFYCALAGLWSGMIIGYITEYYTSYEYSPVKQVARSCSTGAATNIIQGLALGHLSTIIPIIFLAITAFICHTLLGMFGIALGALGMLSTMAVGLAIDAYGPVSDNAGGIVEMCEMGHDIRQRTDQLDAAGNTTAAIGKGFAIGSAALVSLSLYGAFITRSSDPNNQHGINPETGVNVNNPLIFSGLLIGAMLPYAFSALTMKSVAKAAQEMVEEVRKQISDNPGILTGATPPNYENCIKIATNSSISEMFLPATIVIGTPFVVGLFFGPTAVAGILPGILVSGVSMAISSANAGGAWDNAKKFIESGKYKNKDGQTIGKGSDEHKAAVVGDTVGDPLKDTSGPALNILIKLSAIFSLVFASFFDSTALLQCTFSPRSNGCQA
ncbi:hypothetical protein ABPG72_000893 [Tetrahymena utriculariae]